MGLPERRLTLVSTMQSKPYKVRSLSTRQTSSSLAVFSVMETDFNPFLFTNALNHRAALMQVYSCKTQNNQKPE